MSNDSQKNLSIRNSASTFLLFTERPGQDDMEVLYQQGTVWLTQKQMADLFGTSPDNVGLHLKNIFNEGELPIEGTTEESSVVRREGDRQVVRKLKLYNLDAIISVGYRVNSIRATQFRQWATAVLSQFAIKGFALDHQRLENGNILGEDYFAELLEQIREIRLSERHFYQKITDIYITSVDYNPRSPLAQQFFAKVQNKLHFAIHGHTAAELIKERANSSKPHMGLTSWKGGPDSKIVKTDVRVAKNYLSKDEIQALGRIVSAYLDLAEDRAKRKLPTTMEEWEHNLNRFLELTDRDVLQHAGEVSAEIARQHAEGEFKRFRVLQDREFRSDFDKAAKAIEERAEKKDKPSAN